MLLVLLLLFRAPVQRGRGAHHPPLPGGVQPARDALRGARLPRRLRRVRPGQQQDHLNLGAGKRHEVSRGESHLHGAGGAHTT